jgi:hypothetical protein
MRYLSLSWKMLLLMLSMLLLLLTWFTSLSLLHMNDQFKRQQAQRKVQGQQYFQLYNRSAEQQLFSWMQSYAELQRLTRQQDFLQFAAVLPQQMESLQLNFALRQLALVGPQQQVLYQFGDGLALNNRELIQNTLTRQSPQSIIWCETQCYKLLGLPLLNGAGEVAVLLMVTDLSDVMYNIHQTLGTDVALLSVDNDATQVQKVRLLQTSDKDLMQAIYSQLPPDLNIKSARVEGLVVELEQQSYYLHLIALAPQSNNRHFLLMVEDVSTDISDKLQYQRKILWVAAACFIEIGRASCRERVSTVV